MIVVDKARLQRFIVGPHFLANNPKYKFESERIHREVLVYDHHATKFAVARYRHCNPPSQEGRMEATEAVFWYRAMTHDDFTHLLTKNRLNVQDAECDADVEEPSYIGIATNSEYVRKYMGNHKNHTHLVEFRVIGARTLHEEIQAARPKGMEVSAPKAEGNGGTYGLGLKGHYKGAAGVRFNELLGEERIDWRLLCVYIHYKCPDKLSGEYGANP